MNLLDSGGELEFYDNASELDEPLDGISFVSSMADANEGRQLNFLNVLPDNGNWVTNTAVMYEYVQLRKIAVNGKWALKSVEAEQIRSIYKITKNSAYVCGFIEYGRQAKASDNGTKGEIEVWRTGEASDALPHLFLRLTKSLKEPLNL